MLNPPFLFHIPLKWRFSTSLPDCTASYPVFKAVRISNLTKCAIIFSQSVDKLYPCKYSLRPAKQCSVYLLNTINICWVMQFEIALVTSLLGAKFKRKPLAIWLYPLDLKSGRQSIAECHLFYWRWYSGLPALVHSCRTDRGLQKAVDTLVGR